MAMFSNISKVQQLVQQKAQEHEASLTPEQRQERADVSEIQKGQLHAIEQQILATHQAKKEALQRLQRSPAAGSTNYGQIAQLTEKKFDDQIAKLNEQRTKLILGNAGIKRDLADQRANEKIEKEKLSIIDDRYNRGAQDARAERDRETDPETENILRGAANGTSPSAAAAFIRMGLDRSRNSQASEVANAGTRLGAAARIGSARNLVSAEQGAAGQAAAMRAQEMQAGRKDLAEFVTQERGQQTAGALGVLNNAAAIRGQELGRQTAVDQIAQQKMIADLDFKLKKLGMSDAERRSYIEGLTGAGGALLSVAAA